MIIKYLKLKLDVTLKQYKYKSAHGSSARLSKPPKLSARVKI